MISRLDACGTLATTDDAVLLRYCRLHTRAVRLETVCEALDPLMVDGKLHPVFAQLRAYDLALRAYLVELGMTPAARARVKVLPDMARTTRPTKATGLLERMARRGLRGVTGGKA